MVCHHIVSQHVSIEYGAAAAETVHVMVQLETDGVVLIDLPVGAEGILHSAIVTYIFDLAVLIMGHIVDVCAAIQVAELIAAAVPVNDFSEDVPAALAVIQVEHRPGRLEVPAVIYMLFRLTRQGETEAVALPFHGADAHYATDFSAVKGARVTYNLDGLDILRHEVAQFGVVGHLASIQIIYGLTAAKHLQFAVGCNHARHFPEHVEGVARVLEHGAGDVGHDGIALDLRSRQRCAYGCAFKHLGVGTHIHGNDLRKRAERQIDRGISNHGHPHERGALRVREVEHAALDRDVAIYA